MATINIENLNIIKASNDDILKYFNTEYFNTLELVQSLKTELFELNIKIEEIEKTKRLYSFSNDSHRNLFSPIVNEETVVHEKRKILDDQLADLYEAKTSLSNRIVSLEDIIIELKERLDNLSKANTCIKEFLADADYSAIDDTSLDEDGFEFVETPIEEPIINHGYNALMLSEYKNTQVANTLNESIKQLLINNNHKAEVLNWLLNSDIERAKLTVKEILSTNETIISNIEKMNQLLNYNIDSKQPIWMIIDNFVMNYRDNHPECIIEYKTECPDFEIDIHPIITVSLINVLKEIYENIFAHSNANQVTMNIYISSHLIDVYVNDNGVGINPDYLTSSNWYSGLHKVHEIIYLLDGNINIQGDLISGTNIRFSFPIKKVK